VRVLADVSKRTNGTLDVLVNNAGSSSGFGLVSGAITEIRGCSQTMFRMSVSVET
jgi:NADP-dependent 3-hydroxy acid dehydrogenase YdfG